MSSSEASEHRIITLSTDFGYRDPFVGEMKGVILSINPQAKIVDLTHGIEPHDIAEGAFVMGSSPAWFPPGSIHVAVVDPGVGSERRGLIISSEGRYFVGPDNGIFSHILSGHGSWEAVRITSERYTLSLQSPTFQGRDVFSPVAAWLSLGVDLKEFGPPVTDPLRQEIPLPHAQDGAITGEVIHTDRFGNVITNIRKDDLSGSSSFSLEIRRMVIPSVGHYSQVTGLGCLVNSSGYVEIFLREGSAADLLHVSRGEQVRAILSTGEEPRA